MKKSKKMRYFLQALASLAVLVGLFSPSLRVFAAPVTCPDRVVVDKDGGMTVAEACGGHGDPFNTDVAGSCDAASGDCITADIQIAINLLSAGVGLVIVGIIIFAGIQYTTSRDNPQAVQAAKSRILNAVVALIAFVFIYAFLQWVVPGGVF